jgi:catechol 2,3-dioxygenase-like lactoylglutathione lyase family enzyme
VPGHREPEQLSSTVAQYEKRKQALERQGWNHAKIDRRDGVCMVAQECPPSLRWRPSVPDHVFEDRRLGDLEPELEQFTMDARGEGTPIDLYAKYSFAKSDGIPSISNILKLGHVAYRVLDVQKIVKFYTDVLGFRVSDWRGDYFVFMRCNTDHHTVNFIIDEEPQLHHIAFEVVDWAEIRKACDYLAHNKVQLVWGPGRHIIGHNVAIYHRNPDLVRVEIFTEMDQMKDEDLGYFDPRPWHQEFPLYPKTHGPETLRNYWGYGSERVIKGYQTNEVPQYGAIRG